MLKQTAISDANRVVRIFIPFRPVFGARSWSIRGHRRVHLQCPAVNSTRQVVYLVKTCSLQAATCMLRAPWWQMQMRACSGFSSSCRAGTLAIGIACEPGMRQVSHSQGSRTSRSTGVSRWSRAASASHWASSGGERCSIARDFVQSKMECSRRDSVAQGRDTRFEKFGFTPCFRRSTGEQAG